MDKVSLNPILFGVGGAIGLLVSPDLDLNHGNLSNYEIRKVSPLLEHLWFWFWRIYSLALPHRSYWSHFPVVSTFIRLGYIFLIINLIWWGISFALKLPSEFIFFWDWSLFWGLASADFFHALADVTVHGHKD